MNIEYRALGYVLRCFATADRFVGFGRVPGGMADLVYDAGGCCRLRSVAIGFVLLWGRDIGYASCVVSV